MTRELIKEFNNSFGDYIVSESSLKLIKERSLEILCDLKFVCEKYNISYYLDFGTLLGAVRHKGFIPWDDDIDISMFRTDIQKLIVYFKEEFKDKYIIYSPGETPNYHLHFYKISMVNTIKKELLTSSSPIEFGFNIDIFPIDYVPKNKIKIFFLNTFVSVLRKIPGAIFAYKYPVKEVMKADSKVIRAEYRKKRIIGFMFSFLSIKNWIRLTKKIIINKPNNKVVSIFSNDCKYSDLISDKSIYECKSKYYFEGIEFSSIADYNTYLLKLYGDYMKIPSKEERESHFCTKIVDGVKNA